MEALYPNNLKNRACGKEAAAFVAIPPPPTLSAPIAMDISPSAVSEPSIRSRLLQLQIPPIIKDNWLGLVGSMACVIGAVFFGITSGLLSSPEMFLENSPTMNRI